MSSPIQFGIRLNSVSSMQWAGGTILLEDRSRHLLRTSVHEIFDIWPGPAQGLFAVYSDEGVGLLLGRDVASSAYLLSPKALLRSSRTDTVWACFPPDSTHPGSRIVEWHSRGNAREVLRTSLAITDFDPDGAGRILYLTEDGAVHFADGNRGPVSVPMPAQWNGTKPLRVFVNRDATEYAVYAPRVLARLTKVKPEWALYEVDPSKDALVRHVISRRIRIEDKLVPPASVH